MVNNMRRRTTEEYTRPAVCRVSTVTSFLTLFGLVALAIVVKNNIPSPDQRHHPRDFRAASLPASEPLTNVQNDTIKGHQQLSWIDRALSNEDIRIARGQAMAMYMNRSVNPCDDFYAYACGNWETYHPIPDDAGSFDTFEKLRNELIAALVELLDQPESDNDGEAIIKVKKLYKSCMNTSAIEERGDAPLMSLLSLLGDWPIITSEWNATDFDFMKLAADLRLFNNDALFSLFVGPDGMNSNISVLQLDQPTLGLPSRDYFLTDMHKSALNAYKLAINEVGTLMGGEEHTIEKDTNDIIQFERQLANIIKPLEDRRNISGLYEKMNLDTLIEEFPGLNFKFYFDNILSQNISYENITIVLHAYDYLIGLERLLEKSPKRTVANYMLWRFVWYRISNLDNRFGNLRQNLYQVLYGRRTSPPRWKSCVAFVDANMGMALGALFVKNYFPESSKNDTMDLIEEIRNSFGNLLKETDWLDEITKEEAKSKLSAIQPLVGYPDYILEDDRLADDYFALDILEDEYFINVLKFLRGAFEAEISRVNQPVDKEQWNIVPATVNAYYSRQRNQILLPAGILQPPFYHQGLPRALNYGGIGVIIGHEITHGFDDQGRQFDAEGNLRQWWGQESLIQFKEKAQCIIDQYGNYTIDQIWQNINGINTQGENIADNGGIKIAFRAYETWVKENPEEAMNEVLPGLEDLSPFQLFFLNFAQMSCGSMRPEMAMSKIKSAVHSPGKFRVLGSLQNLEEFSKAYGCRICDKMSPPKRCTVW